MSRHLCTEQVGSEKVSWAEQICSCLWQRISVAEDICGRGYVSLHMTEHILCYLWQSRLEVSRWAEQSWRLRLCAGCQGKLPSVNPSFSSNIEIILIFKMILLLQGGFFNWPSPENVSRLAPPKFDWTGPPPNFSKCWNHAQVLRLAPPCFEKVLSVEVGLVWALKTRFVLGGASPRTLIF